MSPDDLSYSDVLRARDLAELDTTRCEEVPVARYLDDECGAVLWLSRTAPVEQTLDVVARDPDGTFGDQYISSGGTDWTPLIGEPAAASLWWSGFTMTALLPSGARAEFATGIVRGPGSTMTIGSMQLTVDFKACDMTEGRFVVRLPAPAAAQIEQDR